MPTSYSRENTMYDHKNFPCSIIFSFQITVIHEPSVFYKTVVEKCRTAKRRITLASLYLGTGHLEEQLVRTNWIVQHPQTSHWCFHHASLSSYWCINCANSMHYRIILKSSYKVKLHSNMFQWRPPPTGKVATTETFWNIFSL